MQRYRTWFVLPAAVLVAVISSSALAATGWTGFRGPNQDGAMRNASLFERDDASLAIGWKRDLGSGYSALAVGDGRVVAMFTSGKDDVVAAFDSTSGDELWRYRFADAYAGHDGSHDGPISTPVMIGGRVYGFGPRGDLFAVNAKDGEKIWQVQTVEAHGAKSPHYGFATSPVLVGDVLVVEIGAPEGKAIAGFNAKNGELKWTAGDDGVNYQSPITAMIGGREQLLAVGDANLYGIDAASGKVLFTYAHGGDARGMGGQTIVPLPAGDDRFFVMNKQDTSAMLTIAKNGEGGYDVSELWSDNSIKSSYVTPVYSDGFIYGISGRILTCVDAASGAVKWRSREPGDGFLTLVGDKLVVMTKPGTLHVAAASPDGFTELAQIQLFDEHSWSEVAYNDGALFARSMTQLARVDVADAVTTMGSAHGWVSGTEFGGFLKSVEAATDKNAVISTYFESQSSFPIVEGTDIVHFVYRGDSEDVGIVGDMIGFRREDPMTRVEGTDLFYYSTRLEPEAAVTYGFIVNYESATADPLNPNPAKGLFGEVSWLAMPAWRAPEFINDSGDSSNGTLETVEWDHEITKEVDGEETKEIEKRTAQVYLPAGFDAASDKRYPTIYVHGGKEALEDGSMKNSLDNLIGNTVQPLIAVFIMPNEAGNAGPPAQYGPMVIEQLIPLIDGKYPTIQDPRARASVGTGGDGTTALTQAIAHPEVYGRVGSQSAVLFGVTLGDMLPSADEQQLTFYLSWGTYDLRSPHEAWDMAENNREAWAAMRASGYRPAGGEVPEGHGWNCWRGHTDEMLAALFPMTR